MVRKLPGSVGIRVETAGPLPIRRAKTDLQKMHGPLLRTPAAGTNPESHALLRSQIIYSPSFGRPEAFILPMKKAGAC